MTSLGGGVVGARSLVEKKDLGEGGESEDSKTVSHPI